MRHQLPKTFTVICKKCFSTIVDVHYWAGEMVYSCMKCDNREEC